MPDSIDPGRRRALGALALLALGTASRAQAPTPGAKAPTPPQPKGPFYPLRLPLDRDNDLVQVAGQQGLARGKITHLIGQVMDDQGRAQPHARIEIWQVNAYGRYHHAQDRQDKPRDPRFQGYGQTLTDGEGAYRFRTIRPVPYPGRAPHIHIIVHGPGFAPLVTQLYVAGAPENEWDLLLNHLSPREQARVVVDFSPSPNTEAQYVARFDIVLKAGGIT